jgi:flagellar hook-associated protein 2
MTTATSSLSSTILNASSASTAAISSPGIGSGLDVNSIVSQLVTAATQNQQTNITNQTNQDNTQISALGSISSALSSLQSSLSGLISGGAATQLSATSGNTNAFTATTSSGAAPASYNVQVLALAQSSTIASGDYASATSTVGDGTVTIGVGANSFTVTLAPGSDSLGSLVSAINSSPNNTGVSASIVGDGGNVRLMLTAQQTGNAGLLSLSSSATADGSSFITTTQVQAPAQAEVSVNGYNYYSDSNTVTGAISGVTLSLLGTTTAATPLTLAYNQQAASTAVQSFVSAYNAAVQSVSSQASYNSSTQVAGPLLGNPLVQALSGQLSSLVGGVFNGTGGNYSLLSQIGISLNSDGTLSLNSSTLSSALSADPNSVQELFSSSNGAGTQLNNLLNGYLGSGGTTGILAASTDSLQTQLTNLGVQQTALNNQSQVLQTQYMAQYTALDTLMSSLKQTSSYLTAAFASLNGTSSSSSSSSSSS